jgi:hypothetical protein
MNDARENRRQLKRIAEFSGRCEADSAWPCLTSSVSQLDVRCAPLAQFGNKSRQQRSILILSCTRGIDTKCSLRPGLADAVQASFRNVIHRGAGAGATMEAVVDGVRCPLLAAFAEDARRDRGRGSRPRRGRRRLRRRRRSSFDGHVWRAPFTQFQAYTTFLRVGQTESRADVILPCRCENAARPRACAYSLGAGPTESSCVVRSPVNA